MEKQMALWALAKIAYKMILRGILKKAVDNPDEDWDDWIINICDKVFDYHENE